MEFNQVKVAKFLNLADNEKQITSMVKSKMWKLLFFVHPVRILLLLGSLALIPLTIETISDFIENENIKFMITFIIVSVLCFIVLVFSYLYESYITKRTMIVLTDKRVVGSLNPTLFTKDKVDFMINKIESIIEDETIPGNIFNYCHVRICTAGSSKTMKVVDKKTASTFKNEFYDLTK